MSVSALTTIAAVRDEAAPTKGDVGKKSNRAANARERASLTNLLVAAIPTEMVAPYTAVTAVIVGSIAEPTVAQPNPDQHELWRWLVFGILVLGTLAMVWIGARQKGSTRKLPVLELLGGGAAAIGWALALPASPLTPHLSADENKFVPAVIAFVAVIVTAVIAAGLGKASSKGR